MAFDNRPKAGFAGARGSANGARYRGNFLWPHKPGSVEEAGYEFANAGIEAYRKTWWIILKARIRRDSRKNAKPASAKL